MADGTVPTSCLGKEAYASVDLARKVLKRRRNAARERKGKAGSLAAYRCHHCGNCHIGNAPRTVKIKNTKQIVREMRRID